MTRLPVQPSADHRTCLGISYDPQDPTCNECPLVSRCKRLVDHWKDRKSLAELADAAQAVLSGSELEAEDLAKLYDQLHARYFGKPPRQPTSRNVNAVMNVSAAYRFCRNKGLDFPMYVGANMSEMRWLVEGKKFPFRPGMLLGDKALERYNKTVRKADRRTAHAQVAAIHAPIDSLRDKLYEGELSVGSYFVAAKLSDPVTWEQAIVAAEPNEEWQAMQSMNQYKLAAKFSQVLLQRAMLTARTAAGVTVAERYGVGLSERIGFRNNIFRWDVLADLIQSISERRVTDDSSVDVVEGQWQPALT